MVASVDLGLLSQCRDAIDAAEHAAWHGNTTLAVGQARTVALIAARLADVWERPPRRRGAWRSGRGQPAAPVPAPDGFDLVRRTHGSVTHLATREPLDGTRRRAAGEVLCVAPDRQPLALVPAADGDQVTCAHCQRIVATLAGVVPGGTHKAC